MYGTSSKHHHQHHHYPNHHNLPKPPVAAVSPESAQAADVFENFISASTFKSVLHHYRLICNILKLRPTNIRQFYPKIKSKIRSWKAQALWNKYDKRASHKCYMHGKAAVNSKVLIIGAGPCGLRAAIEAQLLGAKVVVVEKRDRFSRNNVLHLWPFVIADLRALGAKKFYGKFCAGAIDHISIRQLQCILLKVALLLGVEVIESVAFEELLSPPDNKSHRIGWHARFSPDDHAVNQYEFDILIGADGKRNTILGFKRKEFRGKLAIAITANFINKHTEHEARVQEISGVAFIFNQKFFKELYAETGIDLENIVYYKDETHYFVMTAKKHSLLDKGVIIQDYSDTQQLLHPSNVDREALCAYAREAAEFSTNYQLPHTDFAVNHYGKPDIAMFDFTSMFAADNASRVDEKNGYKLLQLLVGDSLLEPFWPTGSGCARGFLSCFDSGWAIRSWSSGLMNPLEVIAERESIYRLLAQTTPENLAKDISSYTIEPTSRYPTINLRAYKDYQVKCLYISDELLDTVEPEIDEGPRKRRRRDSSVSPDTLLAWFKKQVEHSEGLTVENLNTSFKDGIILCGIIHRYCPFLIEICSLEDNSSNENNQLAFNILEKDFGIKPVISASEIANCEVPDTSTLIPYLTQVYDTFKGEIPQYMHIDDLVKTEEKERHQPPSLDILLNPALLKSQNSGRKRSEGSLIHAKVIDHSSHVHSGDNEFKSRKRKNEINSLDKYNLQQPATESNDAFTDRVKDLEDKFKSRSGDQKPKDLIRTIGKLEKSDWNISAIEKKMVDNVKPVKNEHTEKVPKWGRDNFSEKQLSIERRLRENGEDEDRIAKYLDIDASLKRLERKLKEGSTLDVGQRGHNKVSSLANQLSSKFVRTEEVRTVAKEPKAIVLTSSGSDLCYFCGLRVYLAERMSTEGKYFHKKCFKCSYCNALLRLGNYIYDREGRYGGHFFCIPHYGLSVRSDKSKSITAVAYKTPFSTPEKKDLYLEPSVLDRGTTPERAEFENSVIEQSDEEEYLSEDEWTDRNFGASTNEMDDSEDSECSDFGDDEEENDLNMECQLTADETKKLAEKWKRRYSKKVYDAQNEKNEGFDGDESQTPTEDGEEEELEVLHIEKAMAIRRDELNINVAAVSQSSSDTELASDEDVEEEETEDESEESETHIDTDSEFDEDSKEILDKGLSPDKTISEEDIDMIRDTQLPAKTLPPPPSLPPGPNPYTEKLKNLLQRTECTMAVTAQKNNLLRKNYLLGEANNLPRKSASSVDLGDRFKSFMDKISETQKRLNPAPQPSPAMQAYLKTTKESENQSSIPNNEDNSPVKYSREASPLVSIEKTVKKLALLDAPKYTSSMLSDKNKNEFNIEPVVCDAINQCLVDKIKNVEAINASFINSQSSLDCSDGEIDVIFNKIADDALEHMEKFNDDHNHVLSDEAPSPEYSPDKEMRLSKISTINKLEPVKGKIQDHIPISLDRIIKTHVNKFDSDPIVETIRDDEEFADSNSSNSESELEGENYLINVKNSQDNIYQAIKMDVVIEDNLSKGSDDETKSEDKNSFDRNDSIECEDDSIMEVNEITPEINDSIGEELEWAEEEKALNSAGEDILSGEGLEVNRVIKCDANIENAHIDRPFGVDHIEFMDTSESESSTISNPIAYKELKNEPSDKIAYKSYDNTHTTNCYKLITKSQSFDSKTVTNSFMPFDNNIYRAERVTTTNNIPSYAPASKYEGYIPRFKDRVTPFRNARDSLDVRDVRKTIKQTSTSVEEKVTRGNSDRVKLLDLNSVSTDSKYVPKSSIHTSSTEALTVSPESIKPSPKDGDLVRAMVMSRISKPDKQRRGCRSSLYQSSSRSSLYGSNSSESSPHSIISNSLNDIPQKSCDMSHSESCSANLNESLFDDPSNKNNSISNESIVDKLPSNKFSGLLTYPSEYSYKCKLTEFSYNKDKASASSNESDKPGDLLSNKNKFSEFSYSKEKSSWSSNESTKLSDLLSNKNKFSEFSNNKDKPSASSNESTKLSDILSNINNFSEYSNSKDKSSASSNDYDKTADPSYKKLSEFSDNKYKSNAFCNDMEKPSESLSNNYCNKPNEEPRFSDLLYRKNAHKKNEYNTPNKYSLSSNSSENKREYPAITQEKSPPYVTNIILPATPLTHPEIFESEKSEYSSISNELKSESLKHFNLDNYEYNELDKDSHLINRSRSRIKNSPLIDSTVTIKNSSVIDNANSIKSPSSDSTISINKSPVLKKSSIVIKSYMVDTCSKKHSPPCSKKHSPPSNRSPFSLQSNEMFTVPESIERQRRSSESELPEDLPKVAMRSRAGSYSQWNANTKEERLKKLLAQHRSKEGIKLREKRIVVDRQKRYSEPLADLFKYDPSIDSLIETEPNRLSLITETAKIVPLSSPTCSSLVETLPDPTQPSMRKQKKSKDRERRRSLIQVFTGLFNKSDDKKEKESNTFVDENRPKSPKMVSPKSPTIKEKFSKYRLSRTRDKKEGGNRSQSADCREPYVKSTKSPISLPTTPSRNLLNFLTKSPDRKNNIADGQPDDDCNIFDISEKDGQHTPSSRRRKAALRAAKQAQNKRMRMAQEIQRQLQECEIKMRDLEDKRIRVEKVFKGEVDSPCVDEPELMKEWFSIVHEKNAISRWEQELTVKAKELELEDRHMRLENELRQRMACPESKKKREDINREGEILAEMLSILEQKDSLVSLLEEDRKRYRDEDRDLKEVMQKKGVQVNERETGV